MAINLYIPRIEWNEVIVTGTVTGAPTPTITGIADTSEILVGMAVTGVGIPVDTFVFSKTISTVTLTKNATVNGTAIFAFFERFDFTYPPSIDTEDVIKPQNHVTPALSGKQQVITDFFEAVRDLQFGFLTDAQRNTLRDDFYLAWSGLGREFRYFQDKADSLFEDVELEDFQFSTPRQVKKHPLFLHSLRMKTRRIE